MTNDSFKVIHHGRNVKRLREEKMIHPDVLAALLGEGWTSKRVALLEDTKEIEPALIEELAKALDVTPDEIMNPREESNVNNIQNNHDSASNNNYGHHYYYNCTIDGNLDRIRQLQAEIKKLYEAQLKEKERKIGLLEKLLGRKKK